MVKITSLCTSCVQPITNPLCPYCFTREVLVWLNDKNISPEKIRAVKKSFKRLLMEAEDTPSDISCIGCGAKKVNLCTYCFTNKAIRIIEKALGEGQVLENFTEDFNTQIWLI